MPRPNMTARQKLPPTVKQRVYLGALADRIGYAPPNPQTRLDASLAIEAMERRLERGDVDQADVTRDYEKRDRLLQKRGYASYRAYLASTHWADLKRRYRASKLPQGCYVCGGGPTDLHHRTYRRIGRELLTDLMPLCRQHRGDAHALHNARQSPLWMAAHELRDAG